MLARGSQRVFPQANAELGNASRLKLKIHGTLLHEQGIRHTILKDCGQFVCILLCDKVHFFTFSLLNPHLNLKKKYAAPGPGPGGGDRAHQSCVTALQLSLFFKCVCAG